MVQTRVVPGKQTFRHLGKVVHLTAWTKSTDDTRAQLEDVESIRTGPEGYRDFKSRNDKVNSKATVKCFKSVYRDQRMNVRYTYWQHHPATQVPLPYGPELRTNWTPSCKGRYANILHTAQACTHGIFKRLCSSRKPSCRMTMCWRL